MTELTDNQIKLLTIVADADEGAIAADRHPKTIVALIKKGFVVAVPQTQGPSWVSITQAGRDAIAPQTRQKDAETNHSGAPDEPVAEVATEVATLSATPEQGPVVAEPVSPTTKAKTGKVQVLVDLLRRPGGTTVEAMMAATGWQAHSVRGAMSGAVKKRLGLAITSEKIDGVRVYRIGAEVAA